MKRTPDAEDGFSLVEVLVGLALLALLAGLLAAALGTVRGTQRRHDRATLAAGLEPAEAHLRRALADMRPLRTGVATAPLIEAGASHLRFISGYGPRGAYGGVHRLSLHLVPAATADRFDLEEVRQLHRQSPGDGALRTRLVTDITGLRIRYFGDGQTGGAAGWSEVWNNPSRLPRAVSLEVLVADGDVRRRPAFTVMIPAGN